MYLCGSCRETLEDQSGNTQTCPDCQKEVDAGRMPINASLSFRLMKMSYQEVLHYRITEDSVVADAEALIAGRSRGTGSLGDLLELGCSDFVIWCRGAKEIKMREMGSSPHGCTIYGLFVPSVEGKYVEYYFGDRCNPMTVRLRTVQA